MMSLTARPVMAGKRVASKAARCGPDTVVKFALFRDESAFFGI
jgi:hypothetical protein